MVGRAWLGAEDRLGIIPIATMAQVGPWLDELPHALTLFRPDHEAAAVRRMDPLCPADLRGYRAGHRGDGLKGVRQL